MKDKSFFKDANHLNIFLDLEVDDKVEAFTMDIINRTSLKRRLDLAEDAILCITANLISNYLINVPTIIPGDEKPWRLLRNSGLKWASLERVSSILNAMLDLGYIEKAPGFHSVDKSYASKYWIKKNFPIDPIRGPRIRIDFPNKPVLIRNSDGYEQRVPINNKTKKMASVVNKINKTLDKASVCFNFSMMDLWKDKPSKFISRWKKIAFEVNVGGMVMRTSWGPVSRVMVDSGIIIEGIGYRVVVCVSSIYSSRYSIIMELMGYGGITNNITHLQELNLVGEILLKKQRRIFNNGSFEYGGRLYGASWNVLSKVIRNSITINNEPTFSLDFSGMHIRLCYNLEDIDYRDECYVYKKGDNNTAREAIKLASLIMINAPNRRSGRYAIEGRLKKEDLFESNEQVTNLINSFMEFHKPIKKFLFSNIGIKLQKLDSDIICGVLNKLSEQNIPALSIHDEVIVPEQYKDTAYSIMCGEYRKVMSYEPVL